MKIWNAFASNNSGSYTIVGSFASVELAAEVAAELLEMAKSQSVYMASVDPETRAHPPGPSPLEAMAERYGVSETFDEDEWPQYSEQPHPDVFALGHQVFVHVDYTVTMPRALGALIYAKGGRVQTELDHAHHPIAATFKLYFPWQLKKELDVPALLQRFVDDLCRPGGALSLPQAALAPAWLQTGEFGEGDLVLGVAFQDLGPAYAAVEAAATAIGAKVNVAIAEAYGDPFEHLRPCSPPTTQPLVDVRITDAGEDPKRLTSVMGLAWVQSHIRAMSLVDGLTAIVRQNMPLAAAEQLRDELQANGATVELRISEASSATL